MKKFLTVLVVVLAIALSGCMTGPVFAGQAAGPPPSCVPTMEQKHFQMLYPTVKLITAEATGSGAVVWSDKDEDGLFHTFILTNFHVVKDAIEVKDAWDPDVGREVKKEYRSLITVELFTYNDFSRNVGSRSIQARIVAYDSRQDIALVELVDREQAAPYSVKILPETSLNEIHIYDEVYAVGAALGHQPISTRGMINYMDEEIDNYPYWMSSAQIIFGNSGGAMFRFSEERCQYEYIGIPSRVSALGFGTPVAHMGYFIPISGVWSFLRSIHRSFIFDPLRSYEDDRQERQAVRERHEKLRDLYSIKEGIK